MGNILACLCPADKQSTYQTPYKPDGGKRPAEHGHAQQPPAKRPTTAVSSGALGDTVFKHIGTLEEGEALRAKGHKAGDEAHRLGAESKAAYSSGDGALAKELSNKSKRLWDEQRAAMAAAADVIFAVKNHDRGQWSIDLHLLLVAEAEARTKRRLKTCVAAAASEPGHKRDLVIIYGAGHHSAGGVQKVKPAVMKLLSELQFIEVKDEWDSTTGRHNPGCVSVTVHANHPTSVFGGYGGV